MIPMAWDYDNWPIVDNHNGMVNPMERKPDLEEWRPPLKSRVDNFEDPILDMIWCMRRPVKTPFYTLTERPGYLRLYGNDAKAEDTRTQALLVRRQQHNYFEAAVAMEFEPEQECEEAGMIVTQNDRYAIMAVKEKLDGELFITAYQIINGRRELITRKPAEAGRCICLLRAVPDSTISIMEIQNGKRRFWPQTLTDPSSVRLWQTDL